MFSASRLCIASLVGRRSIATGQRLSADIYKIQSSQEFDEKVKNIEGPVIVDFFATYVLRTVVATSYTPYTH